MSIKEVCSKNVATIEPGATLAEASRLMAENHVGSLVVVEGYDGRRIPAGMITDRDLALAMGGSPHPQKLSVSKIMHSRPVTAKADEGVYDVIQKMRKNGVKRVPVVDSDGALVGIVAADDLLSLTARESAELARIPEMQVKKEGSVSLPSEPEMPI